VRPRGILLASAAFEAGAGESTCAKHHYVVFRCDLIHFVKVGFILISFRYSVVKGGGGVFMTLSVYCGRLWRGKGFGFVLD